MSVRKNSLVCFPSTRSFSFASSGNWHDDDSLFENVQSNEDVHNHRNSSKSSSEDDIDENLRTVWLPPDGLTCPHVLTVDSSEFTNCFTCSSRYADCDQHTLNGKADYSGFPKAGSEIPTGKEPDSFRLESHCPRFLNRERRNTYDMLPKSGLSGPFRQRSSSGNLDKPRAAGVATMSGNTVSHETNEKIGDQLPQLCIKTSPEYSYSQYDFLDIASDVSDPLKLEIGNGDVATEDMIRKGSNGLRKGYMPWKVEDSSGGSYYLRDERGRPTGIFKPEDEEPVGSDCFTSTLLGKVNGVRKGVSVGEGAVREVAAYMLDYEGFAGVPPTALVRLFSTQFVNDTLPLSPKHHEQVLVQSFQRSKSVDTGTASRATGIWKTGSLQVYTSHDSSAEDVACGMFPVETVQRIGVLDIRLFNTDRHCGNILLNFREYQGSRKVDMVPIDHGLCLPDILNIDNDICFAWMDWPQAKEQFTPAVIEYIERLDIDKDLRLIRSCFGTKFSERSLLTLQVGTILLKLGVKYNVSLYDVGCIICGPGPEYPSCADESDGLKINFSPLNQMIKSLSLNFCSATVGESFLKKMSDELEMYMIKMHA